MNQRTILNRMWAAATVALALSGCGGGTGTDSPTEVTSTRRHGPLEFTLTTRRAARRGETVPITFSVTNTGGQTVNATVGPPEAISRVTRAGEEVWNWARNKGFPTVVYDLSLAPRASKTYSLDWDQRDNEGRPVPAGVYRVHAWFTAGRLDGAAVNPETDLAADPIDLLLVE